MTPPSDTSLRKRKILLAVILGIAGLFVILNVLPALVPELAVDFDDMHEAIRNFEREILVTRRQLLTTPDLQDETIQALRHAMSRIEGKTLTQRFGNYAIPATEVVAPIAANLGIAISTAVDSGPLYNGEVIEGRLIDVAFESDVYTALRFVDEAQAKNPWLVIHQIEINSRAEPGAQLVRVTFEWPTWHQEQKKVEIAERIGKAIDHPPVADDGAQQ